MERLANLRAHICETPGSQGWDAGAALAVRPTAATPSVWGSVSMAPPDPILGLNEAFKADPSPDKLNLGVGAYRTEEGKPLVLDAVKQAEMRVVMDPSANKEYLPITGIAEFTVLARRLAFGEAFTAAHAQRVVTVQALSGTGSLRVGATFLAQHHTCKTIHVCSPTWGNHNKIFPLAGLAIKPYRYFDPATKGLDFAGMMEDLGRAEPGAIVLLHACAHNPTGVDPTQEQWRELLRLVLRNRLLCFFDSAYQGFASGCLDRDAFSLRLFAEAGAPMLLAQSFAKNMGLYGERVGALSVVCADRDEARRVESQIKAVIRPMYSSPPAHGAAVARAVLEDPALFALWRRELRAMADRIQAMRTELFNALAEEGVPGSWKHITDQIGMFSFTGLTRAQVANMTRKWHVYMTGDGRISMAGLNAAKCKYLAKAIKDSVANC